MINKRYATSYDIAKMAEEAGVTPDEVKRIIEIWEERKDEMGKDYQKGMEEVIEEVTKMAKDDGVSITEMIDAMLRRKS